MLGQVESSESGKVSYEEFKDFMQECLWSATPLTMKRDTSMNTN